MVLDSIQVCHYQHHHRDLSATMGSFQCQRDMMIQCCLRFQVHPEDLVMVETADLQAAAVEIKVAMVDKDLLAEKEMGSNSSS